MLERNFKILWIRLDSSRRAEKSMELLFEQFSIPIFLLNADFRLLLVNRSAASLLSTFQREEFLLMKNVEFPLMKYFSSEEKEFFGEMMRETLLDHCGRDHVFTVNAMNECTEGVVVEEHVLGKLMNESSGENLLQTREQKAKKILLTTIHVRDKN